jgi:hypothetical protein
VFKIKALPGLPAGFPAVLPAAFDVVPFIQARYGKPLTRPIVFLPSFKCEPASTLPAGRPRPLDLSAEDCAPSPEELAKIKALLAEGKARFTSAAPTTPPSSPAPVAPPSPPTVSAPHIPSPPPPPPQNPVDAEVEQLRRLQSTYRKPSNDRTTTLGDVLKPALAPLTPEELQDAARVREAQRKPASELTAEDAAISGRTLDYCQPERPATVKFGRNGHAKKGGGK